MTTQAVCTAKRQTAIRHLFLLLAIVVSTSLQGHAQFVQMEGGASSLMNAQGGTIQIDTDGRTFSLGLGWRDGLRSGFSLDTPFLGGRLDLGDQSIPFVLPTDVFNPGDYFAGRGAGFRWEGKNESLFLFGGVTSESLDTPFFSAASPQNAVGALFFRHRIGDRFSWSSFNLFSGKLTTIQSLDWTPRQGWNLALSGGIGYQQPYGSASARIHYRRLDLLAGYTVTNAGFRRLRLVSPLMTESDGGNLRVAYRLSARAGFSLSHQNILAPLTESTAIRARVNGLSGWLTAAGFRLNASLFLSRGPTGPSRALMVSAQRSLTDRFHARVNYFQSKAASTAAYEGIDATLREKINAHLYITETYLTGEGRHSLSFGGQFSSNPLDIGVDYQTIFVPFALAGQPPFRQVLMLTVRSHVWRWIGIHATTNYTALGQTRYTAYATAETDSADGLPEPTARSFRGAIGGYVIRGRVQDVNRKPIFGAALLIDGKEVFTRADGVFVLRRKRPGAFVLKVALSSFLFPGKFAVVSAPTKVRAEPDRSASTAVVTLRRLGQKPSSALAKR